MATSNKHTKHESLKCEQCEYTTKNSAFAKQELGRHMKFKHGVNGASSSAVKMQKLAQQAENNVIEHGSLEQAQHILQERSKRTYNKRSKIEENDGTALITVGYIKYLCEAEAEKLGIPKASFTKRCAELFFASQVRE